MPIKINFNQNHNIKINNNNNYNKRSINTSNSVNKNSSLSNPKISNLNNKLIIEQKSGNKININPGYFKKNEGLSKLLTNKSIEIKNNSISNSINSSTNITNSIHSNNAINKNKSSISSLDNEILNSNNSKNIKDSKIGIKSDPKEKINKFYNNRNINLVNNNNNFLIKSKNVNVNNDSLINSAIEYKENDSRNDYFDDLNYNQEININQSINNGDNYKRLYVEDNGESMYKKIKKVQSNFENDFNYNIVNNDYNNRNNRNIQNNLNTNKSIINNTNLSNNSYKHQGYGIIKVVKEANLIKESSSFNNINTESGSNKYNNQNINQYVRPGQGQGQRQSGSINFNQKITSSISTSTKNVTIIDDYYDSHKVKNTNLNTKEINNIRMGMNLNSQSKQDLNGNINVGSKRIIQEVKYQHKKNK